jgi:predicted GIY-YIG superfamily endonuclease
VEGVYLIHFSHKLSHAGHYIGYSADIDKRIANHRAGKSGVALLNAVVKDGAKLHLVRVWHGADRGYERLLKKRKKASQLCPVCNPKGWKKNK